MKRSELKRKTALKAGKGLERRTELKANPAAKPLKRTALKKVSTRQREKTAAATAQVKVEGAAFRAQIAGERCAVCGRTDREAREQTGYGHQAHHAIRQEVLKRLGRLDLLWSPRAAVALCEEPCHRRHTSRKRRVLRAELPGRVLAFAANEGLTVALESEYPA